MKFRSEKVPKMETKRLILRETCISDSADMFEYASDPLIGKLAGWPPHQSEAYTKVVLKNFENKKLFGQLGTVAVILKNNKKMIGTMELHSYTPKFKAELGYTISSDYWGNGYATEASFMMLKWGFEKMGLKRIECNTYISNFRSQKVCEKLHLIYEGVKKKGYMLYDGSVYDLKCYSITDDYFFSDEYQVYMKNMIEGDNNE